MSAPSSFVPRNGFALLLAFSTADCEWECNGCHVSSSPPVLTVTYPDATLELWESLAIAPQLPTTDNFSAASVSITPVLPAGFSFSTADGGIAGTPSATQPPSGLSYTPSSAAVAVAVAVGDLLAPMVASVTGQVEVFSIAPDLPPGLSIDPLTGRIAGSVNAGAGLETYQVTAANPFGSAVAGVSIEVLAGLLERGLLIPCTGDQTVELYDQRGAGVAPIDSVHVNGARAVAVTSDGRWVFIATPLNRLLRCARDPLSARLEDPADLGDVGSVRQLAITSDRRFLIAAGVGFVTRYELSANGDLCCPVQTAGPFAPSAIELASDALALVAASAPGQLRVYEIEPTLALRGAPLNLGPSVTIAALENSEPGVTFYAATSTYNEGSSSFSGVLRRLRFSSAAQVQAGDAALIELQAFDVGAQLTSVRARVDALGPVELLVVDRSLAQLQVWELTDVGAILAGSLRTHPLPGTPARVELANDQRKLLVLDDSAELLRQYDLPIATPNATPQLELELRTRRQPHALVPVRSPGAFAVADEAFVTCAGDSTLRAVLGAPGSLPAAAAAAQGPVANAASPRAVEAHRRLDVVYTANSGAASLSVYAYTPNDLALSLLEEEALAPSARPISLALTPSGRHLHALDENGRVLAFEVDSASGELDAVAGLTVQGSMIDGRLRADRLGRFVFVVQPAAGRVTSLTVNFPTGFLLISNFEKRLPRPIDLWTSPDRRFGYVLDAQLASVFTYSIDRVSGSLVPQGAAFNLGGAPTRLVSGTPGATRSFRSRRRRNCSRWTTRSRAGWECGAPR